MSNNELLRAVEKTMQQMQEGRDFYWEGRFMVFTSTYHRRRGYCCGTGCRHCPYDPQWIKDNTTLTQSSENLEHLEQS